MDREKVIKGFTVCSEHGLLNGEDCHGHYEYTDNLADIIKVNDYSKQCPYNGCETGCIKTFAKDAFALLKEHAPRETFVVIDTKTGKEADIYNIALHEDWAKDLMYCDMEGWAIEDDGTLLLVDECGRYAYADRERFKVKWE